METNRVINMVLADLSLENLKYQEDLELIINRPEEAEIKLFKVKEALRGLVITEQMINKFQTLINKPAETPQKNQPENG